MSSRKRIIVENKRKQQAVVAEHKRKIQYHKLRIRSEVLPKMRKTKQEWYVNSKKNLREIRREWAIRRIEVRAHMKAQQRLHRKKINAHRTRVRIMMNQ